MKNFKVHLGWKPGGMRYAYFETLSAARRFCNKYFAKTNIVLCIEKLS